MRKILYSTSQEWHSNWLFCYYRISALKWNDLPHEWSFNPDHRGQETTQMALHHPTTSPATIFSFVSSLSWSKREEERDLRALWESWQRSNPLRRQHFHWSEQMETCQVTTATGRPVRRLRVQAAEESAWGLAAGASGWSCVGWKCILQKGEICLRKMSTVLNQLNKSLIRYLSAFNIRDPV